MIGVLLGGSVLAGLGLPLIASRIRGQRVVRVVEPRVKVLAAEVTYFDKKAEAVDPPAPGFAADAPPERDGALEILVKGGAALGTGNVLMAGLGMSELAGRIVENGLEGGEGRGDLARVTGVVGLPGFFAAKAAREAAEFLGVTDEKALKAAEQVAAAAALFPPAVPLVALAHGASALLRAISPEADAAVRGALGTLDPTKEGTLPHAVVEGIGNVIEGVFGGGKKEAPPPVPLTPQQQLDAQALADQLEREAAERAKKARKLPRGKVISEDGP